ncbi:hypothetical protein WJX73_004079 [Symbiochloris irregularis]|uniref:Uncharacterized protein n=1 Tax=Symbiochloris irregularis TaxID=706552 RepID=A0AAW1PQ63_9CHLO
MPEPSAQRGRKLPASWNKRKSPAVEAAEATLPQALEDATGSPASGNAARSSRSGAANLPTGQWRNRSFPEGIYTFAHYQQP